MPKINELSMETRAQIVILNKTSHFQCKIAETMGVSKTIVVTTLKQYVETKGFTNQECSGRPRKTSENDDKYIRIISKRDRFKTAPVISVKSIIYNTAHKSLIIVGNVT